MIDTRLGLATNFSFSLKFIWDSCGFVLLRPLWREDGSVIYCCCWTSPAQSRSGLSPAELKTIFCSPSSWDSPNLEGQVPVFISSPRNRVAQIYPWALGSLSVASNDSQGYGGGILSRLHARLSSISYIYTMRPHLWSSGHSSWLQIRRPGFDSRHYQNKTE
jgi:hypothetical protein